MKLNIEKLLPALAVGVGIGALFFYLYKEKRVFSFHGFSSDNGGDGGGDDNKNKKDKDTMDKDDKIKEKTEELKKLIKEDKNNRDMKLGPSGYRRVHHKRGTIKVGNKRREVEIDDGFDPSEVDYERAFGSPEINQFSWGGLSI